MEKVNHAVLQMIEPRKNRTTARLAIFKSSAPSHSLLLRITTFPHSIMPTVSITVFAPFTSDSHPALPLSRNTSQFPALGPRPSSHSATRERARYTACPLCSSNRSTCVAVPRTPAVKCRSTRARYSSFRRGHDAKWERCNAEKQRMRWSRKLCEKDI